MQAKNTQKLLTALVLIMVVAVGPISGSAFGQDETNAVESLDGFEENVESIDSTSDVNETDEENQIENEQKLREEKIREIKEKRAQKVDDFKVRMSELHDDKIRTDIDKPIRPSDVPPEREPDVVFKGSTKGWTVVGGNAYRSSINFTGEAYHIGSGVWKVHVTEGKIKVADREAEIKMNGIAKHHRLTLHGTGELPSGDQFRLFLRGYFAPTPETGLFAIAFTQGAYHNISTGARLPMAQVGSVHVEPIGDFELPKEVSPQVLDTIIS